MDMGSATYLEQMKSLLDSGQLTASQLDDLVRPILAAKYHLGLFEHPYADATDQTHSEMLAKHRQIARTAAARSAVLLRNEGALLPLAKTTRRIAVIGPLGNSKGDMNGPWSLTAKEEDTVSVFEGIRAKLPGFARGIRRGRADSQGIPLLIRGLHWAQDRDALESRRGGPPDEERAEPGRRILMW